MMRTWKIDGSEQQTRQDGGSGCGTTNQTIAERNVAKVRAWMLEQVAEFTREKCAQARPWIWNHPLTHHSQHCHEQGGWLLATSHRRIY